MKKLAPNRMEVNKIKAMFKKGAKPADIAAVMNLYPGPVEKWCAHFKKEGVKPEAPEAPTTPKKVVVPPKSGAKEGPPPA